ncbi:hypothetical protein [Lentzea aerocolonigenes]|uniref:hypothetical protein n=1 Tax=Lentzea aerocolonigenes TaxID=68170 RepID=UPI0004C3FC07|nr:hypothetical protein [Lentzea aerocolonigenes]MCP2250062.1 hypothetical protein [Lentzea aerocolonigenes]
MSTTRCATVIMRVLVRSRVAPAVLTVLNILLDTSTVVTALLLGLAEIVVVLASQPRLTTAHTPVVVDDYRATNAASSACTS